MKFKIDVALLTEYLEAFVRVAKTGVEMTPAIADAVKVWRSGKPPTQADKDALHARIDGDVARLKALE